VRTSQIHKGNERERERELDDNVVSLSAIAIDSTRRKREGKCIHYTAV
jgi:hypothetical protein